MTEHNLRVSARTLRASEGDSGPPWRFGGVAVAAGDILHMDDGTRVLFTESELKAAAETQAGEPLTVDHPADENGKPQYPPPTDETIGKVPQAGWVDDVEGVAYDATTHDEDIARGVQAGTYEVSVHPTFTLGEFDEEAEAYVAENVQFRDLSVVSKGDSPSNTAEYGPNQALASWTAESDIGAELEGSVTDDKQSLVQSAVHGTLEALGLGPGDVDGEVTADASESTDGEESGNEPAEPGADEETDNMGNEETPEDEPEEPTEEEPQTLADMTVEDLGDALKDQGFVTEDSAADLVAEAQEQATKSDKVDEIIAECDDYSDDDREELMASADTLVDSEHERVTSTTGQSIPANAGARDSVTAGFSKDGEDDLDAYGTGVAGE